MLPTQGFSARRVVRSVVHIIAPCGAALLLTLLPADVRGQTPSPTPAAKQSQTTSPTITPPTDTEKAPNGETTREVGIFSRDVALKVKDYEAKGPVWFISLVAIMFVVVMIFAGRKIKDKVTEIQSSWKMLTIGAVVGVTILLLLLSAGMLIFGSTAPGQTVSGQATPPVTSTPSPQSVNPAATPAVIRTGGPAPPQPETNDQPSPTATPAPIPSGPAVIEQVTPSVVQPDGILILTFNKAVKPTSVRIGAVEINSRSGPTKTLEVKVPTNAPLGRQDIALTADGEADPLTSSVVVAPLVLGLKAHKDSPTEMSRVVVAGGEVILQFSQDIPSEIRNKLIVSLRAGNQTQRITYMIPENDYLVLQMPSTLAETTHTVEVSISGANVVLEKRPVLGVVYASSMYWRASLNLLVPILLLYVLFKWFYRVPQGQTRYTFLQVLLLEPENQTYSLSRAQFLAWLTVIVWCYLFIYFAHGYVEQFWTYPLLGGAVYTFLISLGTLVAAQATNKAKGPKGAGEVHPSIADLIVHGGVLALDRVQQVVWTLIALGMFLRITVTSYSTANGLPEIPQELLALMGLSSAGYLGGKLVRGPGPVIDEVTARAGSVILSIRGKHISKDAFVWLDGVRQPKENVKIITEDPDAPQFAKEIELTLDTSLDQWSAGDHVITIVNEDAQRADWRSGPEIVGVTAGTAAGGKVPLTIKGAHLSAGATVEIGDAPNVTAQQDKTNPNLFTATVDEAWPTTAHNLTVASAGQTASYAFQPDSTE